MKEIEAVEIKKAGEVVEIMKAAEVEEIVKIKKVVEVEAEAEEIMKAAEVEKIKMNVPMTEIEVEEATEAAVRISISQPWHVIIAENKATVAVNAKSRKKKGVIEAVETMKAVEEDEDVAEEILTMIETKDIKIQGVVEVIVEF
jgi:hypothetical protein